MRMRCQSCCTCDRLYRTLERLNIMSPSIGAYIDLLPANMFARRAGGPGGSFTRPARRTLSVLHVVVLAICLGQSVCARAADKSDIILDCSDNILGQSSECHDPDALEHVKRLASMYRRLSSAHERDLAFLGKQAKMLLYRSLNNCRNRLGGKSLIEPVNTCIGHQLDEHLILTQGPVTTFSLLDILRHGEFLTLDLIARFPGQFPGLQADWFGSMHLRPSGEGGMTGTISTYHPKLTFPAIMVHPDPDERVFFTEAGCQYECFSWWSGHFERDAERIVFFADNRREAYQRHFGPQG